MKKLVHFGEVQEQKRKGKVYLYLPNIAMAHPRERQLQKEIAKTLQHEYVHKTILEESSLRRKKGRIKGQEKILELMEID